MQLKKEDISKGARDSIRKMLIESKTWMEAITLIKMNGYTIEHLYVLDYLNLLDAKLYQFLIDKNINEKGIEEHINEENYFLEFSKNIKPIKRLNSKYLFVFADDVFFDKIVQMEVPGIIKKITPDLLNKITKDSTILLNGGEKDIYVDSNKELYRGLLKKIKDNSLHYLVIKPNDSKIKRSEYIRRLNNEWK